MCIYNNNILYLFFKNEYYNTVLLYFRLFYQYNH